MIDAKSRLFDGLNRLRYSANQAARVLWYTGHYTAGRRLMGPVTAPGAAPPAAEHGTLDRKRLTQAYRDLFRADWENIKRGEYKMPRDFSRPPSLGRLVRESRDYLKDARDVAHRKHKGGHSEVLTEDARARYPRYYLQNFHYQTDGWLSEESAARYDMQVETLFTGAADAMRRQALPLIRRALEGRDLAQTRVLDLGCGTGRLLSEVMHNWPQLQATALDLSPAYLGRARTALGAFPDVEYRRAAAEETGLPDASFDVILAVYLFHELPPKARAAVAMEIARLLKPGGALIQVDTLQYGDDSGLDYLLETFPRAFHEPYYDSYCRTDLAGLFGGAGLEAGESRLGFLTKSAVFRRPDGARPRN